MTRRRQSPRVKASVAVHFDDRRIATTRDLSPSGVYFIGEGTYERDQPIEFDMEFDSPGGKLLLHCRGRIVRIDNLADRIGVAVEITESVLRRSPERKARPKVVSS